MQDPKSNAGKPENKTDIYGQVLTSQTVANQMVKFLFKDRNSDAIEILDPCVGPGTFPNAMFINSLIKKHDFLTVIDIDPDMTELCRNTINSGKIEFITGDYLKKTFNKKYDYAIFNPPYTRQEWIRNKDTYLKLFKKEYNLSIPGTSNLYVYFILKVIGDLKLNGKFAGIVYDSWQSTIFGTWLIQIIESCCEIECIPVPNQPFKDRLIDATIILGKKNKELASVVGVNRNTLSKISKGPFSDNKNFEFIQNLFFTKRGLRLKQTNFFLCDYKDCDRIGATPFVKKVNLIDGFLVNADHKEAALLVSSKEKPNPKLVVELKKRLDAAIKKPNSNKSILTWYEERPAEWFLHPEPPKATILFNYYIRNKIRHIFNPSRVYSDNFYGLKPLKKIDPLAWLAVLNSTVAQTEIIANSRNQGGGLAKIQLFEYRNVRVPNIELCSLEDLRLLKDIGLQLCHQNIPTEDIISNIDDTLAKIFQDKQMAAKNIKSIFKKHNAFARRPREEINGVA